LDILYRCGAKHLMWTVSSTDHSSDLKLKKNTKTHQVGPKPGFNPPKNQNPIKPIGLGLI